MDSRDRDALRTVAAILTMALTALIWAAYSNWLPTQLAATIRTLSILALWILLGVGALVITLRVTAARRRRKNALFAPFMGANWDGKTGVKITADTSGQPRKIRLKLPPDQPLYDQKLQTRLHQALQLRMGTSAITVSPDFSRHEITAELMSQDQQARLSQEQQTAELSAAFTPLMGADWDQRTGISWSADPTVKPRASHGYTKVALTLPGRVPLADSEIQARLRAIAASKLGTDDLNEFYDPVRNEAQFSVYTVTAQIAQQRALAGRITELEEKFRPFFARPIRATVTEWDPDHQPLRFTLRYESQRGDHSERFARQLEQGASVKLGRRMAVNVDPRSQQIHFEPRPELAPIINHPGIDIYKSQAKKVMLYLGVDTLYQLLGWEVSATSPQPHAAFAGATRAGKSSAIRNAILGAGWHGIETIILDPKYKEFLTYQDFAHVRSIATETEQIVAAIRYVHDEIMEPRYRAAAHAKRGRLPEPEFHPVLLIIDEYIVAQREIKAWWKAKPKTTGEPPELEMMTKLLVKAAGANIHLLIGMQRMDVDFLPGAARDQISFRLALGQISPTLAQMAFGSYYAGLGLPLLQGRGLANPDGIVREIQVYKISEPSRTHSADQQINAAFQQKAASWDGIREWHTPKGMFDTDLAAESNPDLIRAAVEAKTPPATDTPAEPAVIDQIEIPAVSTAASSVVIGDTIRTPDGEIGIVTNITEVATGDDLGLEMTILVGSEPITETYSEDSLIDRVDVIPEAAT